MRSVDEAVEIGVHIPLMPQGGSHHVISRGQKPDFYRPVDLKDKGPGQTAWVEVFQKMLVGLYWTLGAPVPYSFRTPDGKIRSLDAGCIKMMLNRTPPAIEIIQDAHGYVDRLIPSKQLLDLYEPIRARLMKQFTEAAAEDM